MSQCAAMISRPLRSRHIRTAIVLVVAATISANCSGSDASSDGTTIDADAPADTEPPIDTVHADDCHADHGHTDHSHTRHSHCQPTAAPAEFEPLAAGPYDVGVQTITITDTARNRPLTVDVWFPVADAGDAPAHQYSFAGRRLPVPDGRRRARHRHRHGRAVSAGRVQPRQPRHPFPQLHTCPRRSPHTATSSSPPITRATPSSTCSPTPSTPARSSR